MTKPVTCLIHDLQAAVTPSGNGPQRGKGLGALTLYAPASIAITGKEIVAIGTPRDVLRQITTGPETVDVDGHGTVALPGLVDCHTHPVFLGDRASEFELRSKGAGYEEIHAAGGGIRSTVAATRGAQGDALVIATRQHLTWMLDHGTMTAEAKSGYGLDRTTELASLRAACEAGATHAVEVVPTFLGAHTLPLEYDDADRYLDFLIADVLPAALLIAGAADIFLDRGAFDARQARRYLEACARHGLALRLHGDPFPEQGAIPLAVELGARSVDHL
jgi:imidazolonepropionase